MTVNFLSFFIRVVFFWAVAHWYKMSPLEGAFTSTYIFVLYAYFFLKKHPPRPPEVAWLKKLLFYILIVYGCFDVENKVDSILNFLGGLWCPKGTIKFYGDGALKNVPFSRTFSLYADVTLKIRQMGNAVPSPEKGLREGKNFLEEKQIEWCTLIRLHIEM